MQFQIRKQHNRIHHLMNINRNKFRHNIHLMNKHNYRNLDSPLLDDSNLLLPHIK